MPIMTGTEFAIQQVQMTERCYVGLDLGQSHDFSAVCVIRETPSLEGKGHSTYACGHLERFKLDTSYDSIADSIVALMERPELGESPRLVVDATGVGRPVVDMLKNRLASPSQLKAVTIVGGGTTTSGSFGYRAPKRDVVLSLRVLLETGRLKFADLPEVPALIAEVQAFKVRVSESGRDSYGSWRSGTHDDLVLAVSLAVWYAEKYGAPKIGYSYQG
jgi:hypothetical protein